MPTPFNYKTGQRLIRTDAPGVAAERSFIPHLVIPAAAAVAASNTAVLAATALPSAGTTTVTTGITNPAVPRALRIVGNAAGITGNVVISGTNYAGEAISETLAANGTTVVEGNKAFKTITQIVLPTRAAAGDTVSVGFNDKLGIPFKLVRNTVLHAFLGNTREGTAPTVTVSPTALESNTVDLNSALNGTQVDLYLMV